MEREFSAGGVVLRKMRGRWFVAVIEPHMARPKKPAKRAKPPLKRSPRSSPCPRAPSTQGRSRRRPPFARSREETGVQAELITKLTDIKYRYVRNWGDHARVFKIVSFYLLLYRSGKLGNIAPEMRIEVQRAFWLPLDDAPATLNYQGEREVAQRALDYSTPIPS